jgi:hypothetical protein
MIATLDVCNKWILDLWRSQPGDSLIILDKFWEGCRNRGPMRVDRAGSGFPTWIMYLKNPEIYSVWLRPLANAAGTPIRRTFDVKQYEEFNDAVNKLLRQNPCLKPKVEPQEIDYILFRIAKKM